MSLARMSIGQLSLSRRSHRLLARTVNVDAIKYRVHDPIEESKRTV